MIRIGCWKAGMPGGEEAWRPGGCEARRLGCLEAGKIEGEKVRRL